MERNTTLTRVSLPLSPELRDIAEECSRSVELNFSAYTVQSYRLLSGMAQRGISTSALLDTQEGQPIPFPPLADGAARKTTEKGIYLPESMHIQVVSDASEKGATTQARLRAGLRLGNFLVQHRAFPYARVRYQEQNYTFIW